MPNYLVFNYNASQLKTTIYGFDGIDLHPIAVDSDGLFLFSPLSSIIVTATNLDIRSRTSGRDSVLVIANDLDIRNLNGSQDSVQISSRGFVEDTLSTTVSSGTTYLLVKDISQYSQNSYFIRNNGASSITVTLQVAPVNSDTYYVDDSSAQTVAASSNNITSTVTAMKFARLKVVASTSTSVVVYYNARA